MRPGETKSDRGGKLGGIVLNGSGSGSKSPHDSPKPLLIGQAPSRLTQERDGPDAIPAAFSGMSGARLAAFVGIRRDELLNRVTAVNLLSRFPGRTDWRGDDFPLSAAIDSARAKLDVLEPGQTVILAGSNVLAAFAAVENRLAGLQPLERRVIDGVAFISLPHPSPINRWWNSIDNLVRARKLMRGVLNIRVERTEAGQKRGGRIITGP